MSSNSARSTIISEIIRIAFLSCLFLNTSQVARSQYFTDVAIASGIDFITDNALWGCGISFFDFDHDGWDDISCARQGFPPRFFRNTGSSFEEISIPISNTHEMKMILWVDYDNDGDSDLFITRRLGAWQLFRNNGDLTFTDISQAAGLWAVPYSAGWPNSNTTNNTYGASWGDYDKDGDLDLYICNYHHINPTWVNVFFRNNGNDTFTELAVAAGVQDGITTTFQSIFLDTNRENKQDLYLVNDRIYHENKLYSNNEDGTFTNVSAGSGANIAICSMSGTLGDYNNDGLLDIYVTNSLSGNRLLRNNGNYNFSEEATASGTSVFANCWGAAWIDFNLDGWKDLFVPTGNPQGQPVQDYFYVNNQNGTFAYGFLSGFQGVGNESYCAAIGDYNNDGLPDMAVSRRTPFKMGLHRNNGNPGNYIKVSVEGTISNKDGIGTWIDVYANDLTQTHYTRCGEGFMTQDSQRHIFGLGENTMVDSIKVSWLSGIVETYYNLPAGQTHHFVEGMSVGVNLGVEGNNIDLCEGQSAVLDAGNHLSYLWSTGEETQTITVSEPGEYFVQVTNMFGLNLTSETITITDVSLPDYTIIGTNPFCFGEENGLLEIDTDSWSDMTVLLNGQPMTEQIANVSFGENTIQISNDFCAKTELLVIDPAEEILANFETSDVLCFGQANGQLSNVNPTGGTGELVWEIEPASDPTQLQAGSYTLIVTDENDCQIELPFSISQPEALGLEIISENTNTELNTGSANAIVTGGTLPFSYAWSGGEETAQIFNIGQGSYSITVTDANGCTVVGEANISVGINENEHTCSPLIMGDRFLVPCNNVAHLWFYDLTGRLIREINRPIGAIDIQHHTVSLVRITLDSGESQVFKIYPNR